MRIIIKYSESEWERRQAEAARINASGTDVGCYKPDRDALRVAARAFRAGRKIPGGASIVEAVDIADPSGNVLFTPMGEQV